MLLTVAALPYRVGHGNQSGGALIGTAAPVADGSVPTEAARDGNGISPGGPSTRGGAAMAEDAMDRARQAASDWLSGHHNPNTRRAYERDVGLFLDWCAEQKLDPLGEMRRVHGNMYLSSLLERGGTNQTIHRKLVGARQFCEYLLSEELVERNPFQHVKFRWQRGDSETPWLDADELRRLLAAATQTDAPLRDFVLCALLGLNGLRIGEVDKARVEDLGETGGTRVLWVQRKGNKRTRVPLDPRVAEVMDRYLDWLGNPSEGPLVVAITRYGKPRIPLRSVEKVSAGKRLKKLARAAGVNPNISPHSLRHSFATLALGEGVPLHFVQSAMAHANPSTTQHYNREADSLDNHPTSLVTDLLFGADADDASPKAIVEVPAELTGGGGG